MVVVDTSVWVDYFNGVDTRQAELLDRWLGEQVLVLGDLVLAELLQGFGTEAEASRARRLLAPLQFQEMVGHDVACQAAANFRLLRRRGATVRKTIDLLIGTFCIVNDHALLHADRDFLPLERHLGLQSARA